MSRSFRMRLPFAALLVLTLTVASGCVAARMGVSWPSVSLVGESQNILLAHSNFIVQIDPADGTEVRLRDAEGRVRVDPATGEARTWEVLEAASAGGSFHTAPLLIEDGTSLLTTEYNNRKFVTIDFEAARIENPAGVTITGQPVADFAVDEDEGLLFVGYNSANLEAFDLDTLDIQWTFETRSGVWAKPLVHEGVVYFTSMDHKLYAVDIGGGDLIWELDLGGASASTPLLVDDRLYVGTFARTVLEITLDGTQTASYTAANWIWGSPVSDGETLYAADLSGFVYALSVPGLNEEWATAAAPTGIRASPLLLGDDQLVVVSRNGKLAWLNRSNGLENFSREIENEVLSDLLLVPSGANRSEPLVVVAGVNLNPLLAAFTATDGQRVWTYNR